MKMDDETYSAIGEVGDFQQKRTRWARIRLDLAKSPMTAKFGLLVILIYVVVALFAPLIAPYGEAEVFPIPYAPWSSDFVFGTDQIGRDIFSRLIYGARNTVGIAVATTALAFIIGGILGLAAAIGLDATAWGREQTCSLPNGERAGPFEELLTDFDILINAIKLDEHASVLLTRASLMNVAERRRLSVIVDVSCDSSSPLNVICLV